MFSSQFLNVSTKFKFSFSSVSMGVIYKTEQIPEHWLSVDPPDAAMPVNELHAVGGKKTRVSSHLFSDRPLVFVWTPSAEVLPLKQLNKL